MRQAMGLTDLMDFLSVGDHMAGFSVSERTDNSRLCTCSGSVTRRSEPAFFQRIMQADPCFLRSQLLLDLLYHFQIIPYFLETGLEREDR